MIVSIMGLLNLLGVPLGPIESLSLSIVIGVSVDYLVHIAFAYTHALMPQRYYKSRAAYLARTTSIVSASITTLCAVVPLLWAKMLPLRQFGIIFTLVAILSLFFTLGFFGTLLMIGGPGTRLQRERRVRLKTSFDDVSSSSDDDSGGENESSMHFPRIEPEPRVIELKSINPPGLGQTPA